MGFARSIREDRATAGQALDTTLPGTLRSGQALACNVSTLRTGTKGRHDRVADRRCRPGNREDCPAQDEGRTRRRRARRLLAAVPRAPAAAAGVRPARVRTAGPARLRGGRPWVHLPWPAR